MRGLEAFCISGELATKIRFLRVVSANSRLIGSGSLCRIVASIAKGLQRAKYQRSFRTPLQAPGQTLCRACKNKTGTGRGSVVPRYRDAECRQEANHWLRCSERFLTQSRSPLGALAIQADRRNQVALREKTEQGHGDPLKAYAVGVRGLVARSQVSAYGERKISSKQ